MTILLNARRTSRSLALAALFAAAFAGLAAAEEVKIPDGELPPPAQAEPEKPKPCVTDQTGFWTHNGVHSFKVALTNACEQRQRCIVNVYVVTSRGPQKGQATLTLDKASQGQTTHKDYVIRIPENAGSAQVSRNCKAV